MLVSLHVKNLALIEETEVEFGKGLNILTGETGAGKSILLGSVNLALGAKANADIIRNGADFALVELTFEAKDSRVKEKLKMLDLPVEDYVTISRKISPSRNVSRINGETVTAKQVKELAEYLIDIHGQHEHQSLLQKNKHLSLLDEYAGMEALEQKKKVEEVYRQRKQLLDEMNAKGMDDAFRKRELDLLSFEYEEIENACLKDGEDEELEPRFAYLKNGSKILEAVSVAHECLSGLDGADSRVDRAIKEIGSVSKYDEKLSEFYSCLITVENLLTEVNRSLADYMDEQTFDEKELYKVEERLNEINHLKDKFGGSISAVLSYQEKIGQTIEKYADYENYKAKLTEEVKKADALLKKECESLSLLRKKAAKGFAEEMKKSLEEMNFLAVDFEVGIKEKEPAPDGFDDVEFMISTNPGEPKRSLSMVASGGELSRIMLALKTMIAGKDDIDTLIFDEIDAGISGKTAWKVSEKLSRLSKNHQVICITHLPQIAAMGDNHFAIEKSTDGNSTTTTIRFLDDQGQLKELARLLGADEVSAAALQNAKELKEQAKELK